MMGLFSKIFGKSAKTKGNDLPWSNESKLLLNQLFDIYDDGDFRSQLMTAQVTGVTSPAIIPKVQKVDNLCRTICENEGIENAELLRILQTNLE